MSFNPFVNGGGGTSSEDKVARAEIAAIKDGETLDSFGDVETALDTKANTSTTYTKTEVDTALSAKADKSTTYTKTEVDTALDDKVDKETGKGLSTNDYTTAEKTKLAGIAEGAEVNEIEGIKVNNTSINPDANKVVNITVPTTAADVSALPDTTKYAAALSLTINSSTFIMTGQLKDQNGDNLGTAQTIDLPLESVVVGGSYNSQTKKVVLTLQNGNTIEFSVADLVSGLQTEFSTSNKLNPAFIEYDSTHRAVSDTEKSAWNSKQNALTTTQLDAVNSGIDSTKVEQIETNENNILSIYNTGFAQKNVLHIVLDEVKAIQSWARFIDNTINFGNLAVTFNDDNSITLNGSHTVNVAINFKDLSHINIPTNAVGTASANIALSNDIFFGLWGDSGVPNLVLNDGVDIPSDYASKYSRGFIIRVSANTVCDNVRIYPMVCDKALYQASPEVVPYALSNVELTAKEQANENNILSVADQSTQYNIVPIKSTITTGNASVTATVAADKTITIEITGTTSTAVGFEISDNFAVDTSAQYVMTGCPSSGAVRLILQHAESPYTWIEQQYSGQAVVVSPNISLVRYYIYIYANSSGTITIKPMLIEKSLYDAGFTDYQPYALPNTTLTPALQECVDKGSKNIANIPDSTITGSNYVFNNVACNIPVGSYVFSYTSNQSQSGNVEFIVKNSGGTTIFSKTVTSQSGRVAIPFTIAETGAKLILYSVRAGTYSNFMICTEAEYNASQTYQPYAMSNAELTVKEQQNENNISINRSEIADIVDNGAKNIAIIANASQSNMTATVQSDGFTIGITGNNQTGNKTIKWGSFTIPKTGAYAVDYEITGSGGSFLIVDETSQTTVREYYPEHTSYYVESLTAGHNYSIRTYRSGAIDTTISLLICNESARIISDKKVPYCPSLAELYALVKSYHSGS